MHCYWSAFLCDSLGGKGGMGLKRVGDIREELGLGVWWRERPIRRWFVRDAMEKMTVEPLRGGAKESDNPWQVGDNE